MTVPTITYGHGLTEDCDDDTGYSEVNFGMTAGQTSLVVENGDIFKLTGVCDSSSDEFVMYEKDITNISTDVYTKFLARWKTSAASNGLGAKIIIVFTSGNQTILGASAPEFSTTWQVTSGTLTAGKTIDKIQFYADDNPNSVASGTYQVYYDFLLLHKDTFTFPNFTDLTVDFPKKVARLAIPGREGDILQDLGMGSAEIVLSGDIMSGKSWGSPDGEYFYYIVRDDPWQWFSSDVINCKVVVERPRLAQVASSGHQRTWELRMLQYSLSDLGLSTWDSKQWFQ